MADIDRGAFFEQRRQGVAQWKRKKVSAGLCGYCGAFPLLSTTRCARCLERHRLSQRQRRTTADEKWKRVARQTITEAVRRGIITRPERCQRCGCEGFVQAHHRDYSKRRDVEWLCVGCHAKEHRLG